MKKKQKKILLILFLLLILLAVVLLQKQKKQNDSTFIPTDSISPTIKLEVVQQDASSENDLRLNAEEKIVLDQVIKLKNLTPIATPDFTIEFSYKTGNFIVKSNKSLSATEKNLELWLNKNGFDAIEDTRFEYQSSKLAL